MIKIPSKKAAYRYLKEQKLIHCGYDKFRRDVKSKEHIENMYTFEEVQ